MQLQHILRAGDKLSKHVYECESITLPQPGGLDDGGQMTPDTVLLESMMTDSGSSGGSGVGCRSLGCTATTEVEVVRKKRSSNSSGSRPACGPVLEISNRRKGAPHRAPLY